MKVRLLSFLLVLSLVFALLASPALALHAIQDEGFGTISLDAVSGTRVPEQASGTAKFRVTSDTDGFYNVRVRIRVYSLPERAGRIYEAWLVDDETDYSLSLGAFNTDNDGDRTFTVERPINYLASYDRILVSSEVRQDLNPERDGPVVLEGEQR